MQVLAEQLKGAHEFGIRLMPPPAGGHRSPIYLRAFLCDETRRRAFDIVLQTIEELFLAETGRDRIEDFSNNSAGKPAQRSAWPEQAGVERNRNARYAFGRIKVSYTDLVAGLGTRRPASDLPGR